MAKRSPKFITVRVDLAADAFSAHAADVVDGADITHLAHLVTARGVTPQRLTVVQAVGPGGGNPFCHASFTNEWAARQWFGCVADDDDHNWFNENRV